MKTVAEVGLMSGMTHTFLHPQAYPEAFWDALSIMDEAQRL